MKLFARSREGLLYDSGSMEFVWPMAQKHETVLHGLATMSYNSGHTAYYRIDAINNGTGGNTRSADDLNGGGVQGALDFRGTWTTASHNDAGGHDYLSGTLAALKTSWSIAFTAKLNRISTSATFALFEFGYGPAPGHSRELNMLGCYVDQATRRLTLRWDRNTSDVMAIDTPVTIGASGDHFSIAFERVDSVGALTIFKNGRLAYSDPSVWGQSDLAASGTSANWRVGGSCRYGTSVTVPGLVSGVDVGESLTMSDIGLFRFPITDAKAKEIYGNAKRTWDEEALIKSGQYRLHHRVLVKENGSVYENLGWQDLSNFRGRDWTQTASVSANVEADRKTAKIKLRRRYGRFLDLARLNVESSTYDSDREQQLIDLRTRIRVEYALVPVWWSMEGWEWAPLFDGFVDGLDWGTDVLDIDAIDKSAALSDVFRIEARRYEYGPGSVTLSSEHMQTLITDNVPRTLRPGSEGGFVTWGYLGGTPELYTPVSDEWIQRYEHGGSGNVLKLLQGVADQIGWDVRYAPYHPLGRDRLTYYEPPRNLASPLSDCREGDENQTIVTFDYPHGYQVGQAVVISDVPNFSTRGFVIEVPTWNKIVVDKQPPGTPAAETAGNVEHGPHFTLSAANVLSVGRVGMSIEDIRNHIVIKYNREGSSATYPVASMYSAGDNLIIELDETVDISMLEAGAEVTIESPDAGFSGTRAIVAINGNAVEVTPKGSASGTSSSGIFQSDWLAFNSFITVHSASIAKYGLRSAGVFEGSVEGVDTYEEAARLGRGMLSDMADPTVDLNATILPLPHIDLHDLLGFTADPLGRWKAMNVAVVGFTHELGPSPSTRLELRHDHPSKGTAWLSRGKGMSLDVPGTWGVPDRNIDINVDVDLGFDFDFNPDIGPYFSAAWTPAKGKQSWLHDKTEVHLSTTSGGFIPTNQTLVSSARGAGAVLANTPGGRLSPGTTYYFQLRHRDRWGNVSGTHTGVSAGYTMRFLPKPPGAAAFLASSVTSWFTRGEWSSVFGVTSSTGGYDPYNNFTSNVPFAPGGAGCSTAPLAYTDSASFFVMPCDGQLQVDARLGLRCSGKDTQQVAIGIFRRRVGETHTYSAPFLYPRMELEAVPATTQMLRYPSDGFVGFLMGSSTKTVAYYFNDETPVPLATTAYARFNEVFTCSSGDQVLVAVRPELNADDFMITPTDSTTTASTGWVRYTVLSQTPNPTGS